MRTGPKAAVVAGACVVALTLASSVCIGAPNVGPFGLLTNVHGYNYCGTSMLPVRAFAEWIGASVNFEKGRVDIHHRGIKAHFSIGELTAYADDQRFWMVEPGREFGGITCVPARFFAKAFGIEVEYCPEEPYVTGASEEGEYAHTAREVMANIPVLVVSDGQRKAVILVHGARPDVVAQVIRDLEQFPQRDLDEGNSEFNLGDYGTDWILEVTAPYHDYFMSFWPAKQGCEWARPAYEGFCSSAWALYGVRDGRWKYIMRGQDNRSRADCRNAGVPLDVATKFGIIEVSPPPPPDSGASSSKDEAKPGNVEVVVHRYLSPETASGVTSIGDHTFVSSLTFRPEYGGSKVMGIIHTPAFKKTSKPVHMELTLIGYDVNGGMLDHTTIDLYGIPSEGASVPFDELLLDAPPDQLFFVSIQVKGAWTYGKD